MKAAIPLVLVIVAATGCASLGATQGNSTIASSSGNNAGSPSPATANPFPAPDENIGPRLIIPATGGPPVLGIPVGGILFLPVTGGPPVSGIPLSP